MAFVLATRVEAHHDTWAAIGAAEAHGTTSGRDESPRRRGLHVYNGAHALIAEVVDIVGVAVCCCC